MITMRASYVRTAILLSLIGALSACVSDTLSQQNTQPQAITRSKPVNHDPAQREQAVAEIRAKAAQSGSGELTNAYLAADGPGAPFTPEEQAAKIRELEEAASANSAQAPDAELAENERSIRELQSQARSHYDNALNKIQN